MKFLKKIKKIKLLSIRRNILHTQCKSCLLCLHIKYTVFYILYPWKYKTMKIELFTDKIKFGMYSNKQIDFEIRKDL